MYHRSHLRKRDGKQHRCFLVVESRRPASGKTMQRHVLYLGKINDSKQAAWRKTMEVFDESAERFRPLSLFPNDREPGPEQAMLLHKFDLQLPPQPPPRIRAKTEASPQSLLKM